VAAVREATLRREVSRAATVVVTVTARAGPTASPPVSDSVRSRPVIRLVRRNRAAIPAEGKCWLDLQFSYFTQKKKDPDLNWL